MLGLRLVSLHNVHFFLEMMRQAREAIRQDAFGEFKKEFIGKYNGRYIGTGSQFQSIDWIPEHDGLFFIETFVVWFIFIQNPSASESSLRFEFCGYSLS